MGGAKKVGLQKSNREVCQKKKASRARCLRRARNNRHAVVESLPPPSTQPQESEIERGHNPEPQEHNTDTNLAENDAVVVEMNPMSEPHESDATESIKDDNAIMIAIESPLPAFIQPLEPFEFDYEYANFNQVPVRGDGNCLYASLAFFIQPLPPSESVRAQIEKFYKKCKSPLLPRFLDLKEKETPANYAIAKKIGQDKEWGTCNEVVVASTLFQRPIYIFTPQNEHDKAEKWKIRKCSPLFTAEPVWSVQGIPETPIVLRCTHPDGQHFEPLNLSRQLVSTPNKFENSRKRKRDASSQTKSGHQNTEILLKSRLVKSQAENAALLQQNAEYQAKVKKLEEQLQQMSEDKTTANQIQQTSITGPDMALLHTKIAELEAQLGRQKQQEYEIVGLAGFPNKSWIKVRKVDEKRKCKTYRNIPQCREPFSITSRWTRQSRISVLDSVVEAVAGNHTAEQKAVVVSSYLKKNSDVLKEMCSDENPLPLFSRKLTKGQSLDLQLELGLTDNGMSKLQHRLSSYGMNPLASERQIRKEVQERRIQTEMEECTVTLQESGGAEVKRRCIRAPKLVPYIKEMFAETRKRNCLVADDRFEKHIWLAFSGDAGGGTTKIIFCFGNVQKASSVNNIHILAIYEGDDSAENLRRVLSHYEQEWDELKATKFQQPPQSAEASCDLETESSDSESESDARIVNVTLEPWPLRLFLFGDLKFISNMMGHAGCTSSSPCIFCHLNLNEIRKPSRKFFQENHQHRKLEEWETILQQGKKAMKSAGIKCKPIFPFEIDNIFPPVLHIMLGLGTDLVNKIEKACFRRDLSLDSGQNATKIYKQACTKSNAAKAEYEEASLQRQQAEQIVQAITQAVSQEQPPKQRVSKRSTTKKECKATVCIAEKRSSRGAWETCNKCKNYYHLECCLVISEEEQDEIRNAGNHTWLCPRCQGKDQSRIAILKEARDFLAEMQKAETEALAIWTPMQEKVESFFSTMVEKQGPAIQAYQKAFDALRIDRQAFHGGVFVGNHIHKMIIEDGPAIMTQCLESIIPAEKAERDIYQQLLTNLGTIVSLMGKAKFLSDKEISDLCGSCQRMGELYGNLLEKPDVTITPKLHILVEHVPQFSKRFKTVALISEHGLESLHASLNKVARRYACLRSIHRVMRAMMKEHQLAAGRMRQHTGLESMCYEENLTG